MPSCLVTYYYFYSKDHLISTFSIFYYLLEKEITPKRKKNLIPLDREISTLRITLEILL